MDVRDCQAQVKKGLAKLRWSIQKQDCKERGDECDKCEFFKVEASVFELYETYESN